MMPNRTLQSRLAIFYGGVFLICGVVLLAIPNLALYQGRSTQHVGQSTVDHQSDAHQLLVASAIALVVLVPVSLGLGWLASGRLLQPLRRITATAQQISASNLRQRLELGNASADELSQLGNVLDGLFDRLEAAFERNDGSSPTLRTNCARRWPDNARSFKWRWPIRTQASKACERPVRRR
jgi:methyl-accepting chemotaxis protein